MTLRPATPSDLDTLMAIEGAAEGAAHWSEQGYKALFEKGMARRLCWVDERVVPGSQSINLKNVNADSVDSKVITGFYAAICLPGEWELENIAVRPEWQRQGIGRCLMEHLIGEARRAEVEQILLEVRFSNTAAHSLYKALGFAANGHRRAYYSDPEEDALLMVLSLEKKF